MNSEFLSEREAAQLLALQPGQLKMARRRGQLGIPFYAFGRSIRYRRDELFAWIEQQRIEPRKRDVEKTLPKIKPRPARKRP